MTPPHRAGALVRLAAVALSLALLASPAVAQMPDLSQMNGRSLPAPDAPVGSATVRVMRETLGNNVVGQEVTLTDANGVSIGTRKTDDAGRATFEGLRPGTAYTAVAVVSGERLVVAAVHAAAVGWRARGAGRRAGRGRRPSDWRTARGRGETGRRPAASRSARSPG